MFFERLCSIKSAVNKVLCYMAPILITSYYLLVSPYAFSDNKGLLLGQTGEANAKKLKVSFVCPCGEKLNHYWRSHISFIKAVAVDLGVDLRVVTPGETRRLQIQSMLREMELKPDYMITVFVRGLGHQIIEASGRYKVPLMLVNVDMDERDKNRVGLPREKFPFWIGQLAPDDTTAGYDLANKLIAEARLRQKASGDGNIHLVAISGKEQNNFVRYRLKGLERAVREDSNVVLEQVLPTQWDDPLFQEKIGKLLKRFPETSVFWCVTSELAQKIIAFMDSTGRKSGDDYIIGGIDWTSESINALSEGKQNISLGGHFMEGARALVMLYDYHHGRDFGDGNNFFLKKLEVLSRANIETYSDVLNHENWGNINFKQLTHTHNSNFLGYEFSIDNLHRNYSTPD